MRNELFDDPNDWLTEQRKRESKISAWDIDDAKKLKEEHEKIHSSQIRYMEKKKNNYDNQKGNYYSSNSSLSKNETLDAVKAFLNVIRAFVSIYFIFVIIQFLIAIVGSGFLEFLLA